MSTTGKTVIIAVVALIVLSGLYYWHSSVSGPFMPAYNHGATTTDSTALSSGSDTSDAGIDQDMTQVGGQMQGMNSDSTSVDQSMGATGGIQ